MEKQINNRKIAKSGKYLFNSILVKGNKMNDIYENETGEKLYKNSTAKMLLVVAIKKQLQGKISASELIFNSVANHCSVSFNIDREIVKAQKNALNLVQNCS